MWLTPLPRDATLHPSRRPHPFPTTPPHPRYPMTRVLAAALFVAATAAGVRATDTAPMPRTKVAVGQPAPAFQIKDATGKVVDLAELTAKGPVLVRLTCGCTGCDKELAYFKELSAAYKGQGLISLYVFKE